MTQASFATPATGLAWTETATEYGLYEVGQVSGVIYPIFGRELPTRTWMRFSWSAKERGTPSIADTVEETLSTAEELGARLVSPLVLRRYFFENLEAAPFVTLAISVLESNLPRTAVLTLQVERHPDSVIEELVILVRSDEYDDTFLDRLDRAREPLLALMGSSKAPIAITTDFRRPDSWPSTGVTF